MLTCVTNQDQISQNPSNTSLAKQLYTFPKGPRFVHYTKGYNREVSYEAPTQFKKPKNFGKSLGFGVARPELFP